MKNKTYTTEFFRKKGRKGGISTSKRYSAEVRRKWNSKGGKNRHKDNPKQEKTRGKGY